MIPSGVINFIAGKTKIKQKELIEKDLILHRLLLELTNIPQFAENYIFKGGTCLMKCYFGYYRFSEDLDFTYNNQKEFENKKEKQIRKIISEKIDSLGKIIYEMSVKIGLDFKPDKKDKRYFEFGGGNKFTTMRLWYTSEESKKEIFVKIQINFVEKIIYPLKKHRADNIFFGEYDKFQMAFALPKDFEWILKIPETKCYDLREILTEKVRAILTRKGVKGRDFVDVFLISKEKNLNPEGFKKEIIDKTRLMIEKYGKYADNIKDKDFSFMNKFVLGEEEKLMIKKIPDGFEDFLRDFRNFLESLVQELRK